MAHPTVSCIRLLFLHVWFFCSLKMETAVFSKAWVPVHCTVRCHILEDYSCQVIPCFHRIWKFVTTIFMGSNTLIMSKWNSLHSHTPCLSNFHFSIIVLSLLVRFSEWNVEWFFISLSHSPNLLVIVLWQLQFSFLHSFLSSTLFPVVLTLFLL